MQRTVVGIFLALLLCGAGSGCEQTPAPPAAGLRPGDWWGGFGLMDGDKLHWSHIMATLRVEGRTVTGDGQYAAGPDQGISDKTVEISGRFEGERLSLRLSYGGKRIDCEATYDTESASGTCRVDGEELSFRLIRVSSFDPEEVKAIQAVYQFDEGRRILVGQLGPMPMMLELPSGVFRVLFPKGNRTWVAGPRLLVGAPEEWRLIFTGDGVTVQRSGETPQHGKRRPGYTEEPFAFDSEYDGATLRGTLTLPHGPGPHPGIVWVHGSGHTPRSEAMFFPLYLSDLGFAVLAFDKRGVGESEGSYSMPDGTTFSAPFLRRRGADVASAMNALRRHRRTTDGPVGLFGISQAGWVIPVAASSTECAFTLTMSGGATPLSQEEYFSALTDELSSDASLPSVEDALAKVRAREAQGHDWSTDFATQRCPGLWLYGLNDRINPSQLCVEALERVKSKHDKDFTIVTFPDGNHPLMQSKLGGKAESLVLSQFVPGMFTTIEAWLDGR